MTRSNSESSLQSWAAISDVSWVEIESKASDCGWEELLDEQMPALTAAELALPLKKDIAEIKKLKCPPEGVRLTMEVVCILLQVRPKRLKNGGVDYWDSSKRLLSQTDFLDKLIALRDCVPASALDAV